MSSENHVPFLPNNENGTRSHALMSFDQAVYVGDFARRQRRIRRRLVFWKTFIIVMTSLALCVGAYPFVLQWRSAYTQADVAARTTRIVEGRDQRQRQAALDAAHAYNQALAQNGQTALAQSPDPYSTALLGGALEDVGTEGDALYRSLLDVGDGLMGRIRIPKISLDLPVYHGTGKAALDAGVGHVYDTSLPVGGSSTHSVLTAHRGMVGALMFTRLDEMVKGDVFSLEVMGETLTYRVDRVAVINPNDVSKLKIVPGEDRVTLMTCTPYGVNTQRLLVSGVRTTQAIPKQTDGRRAIAIGVMTGASAAALGMAVTAIARRETRPRFARHRS